ncbi:MAG: serine/threonine protein kinase [Deltaproteobacteria bacterium]|nr:serine/threonine protein kinase [Deltaproteobacteria bacterium]
MRIGRYEVLSVLGQGAYGEVFHAKLAGPMGFSREVAIKRIHPHLVRGDEKVVQSLIDEARLGGLLRHPNIVQSHEFEQDHGTWFLTMEYVDGITLRDLLQRSSDAERPLPVAVALELVEQVCRGLDYAHSLQVHGEKMDIVHRDLKPANLMLSRDGLIKIMDFGMAKASSNIRESTMSGTAKGTPAYMSPEQVRGSKSVTAASDIFAIGVVFFELMTGERVFDEDTAVAVMFSVVGGVSEDKVTRIEEVLPGAGEVFARATAKAPEERWHSAGEFGRAIRALRDLLDEPAESSRAAARALFDGPSTLDPGELTSRSDSFRAFVSAVHPAVHSARTSRPKPEAPPPRLDDTVDLSDGMADTEPVFPVGDDLPGSAQLMGERGTSADVAASNWMGDTEAVPPVHGDLPSSTQLMRTRGSSADVSATTDIAGISSGSIDPALLEPPPVASSGRGGLIAGVAALGIVLAAGGWWLGRGASVPPDEGRAADAGMSSDAGLPASANEPTSTVAVRSPDEGATSEPTPTPEEPSPAPTPEPDDAPPDPTPERVAEVTPAAPSPTPEEPAKVEAAPEGSGLLVVRSSPWGWVSVDGGREQKTPLRLDAVPAGHHVVIVRCGECAEPSSETFEVELAQDGREIIRAEFAL